MLQLPTEAEFRALLERMPADRRTFVESQLVGVGDTPPAEEPDPLQLSKLEKDEQAAVVRVLKTAGCVVYNLSQPRATKQTAGLPDLWWCHAQRGVAGWFEVKRGKTEDTRAGEMTQEQIEFRDECIRTGTPHGVGDRQDAAKFVVDVIMEHGGMIINPPREPVHWISEKVIA